MKILGKLLGMPFVVCFLTAGFETNLPAQMTPSPAQTPLPAQTPHGPGQAPDAQAGRMQPTGIEANGGSIANGVYSNSIYGFSLKTPPGWPVVPSKDAMPLKSQSDDPAIIKAAQLIHPLLVMTENAPLRKASERKSIQILAMRLAVKGSPTSAQDYLAYSQKTAKDKGMAVEYLGDPEEVTINGQKLWKVASDQTTNGAVQYLEQYVIMRGIVLLQFFIVSPDQAGLKDLEPWIQSLEFKPLSPKQSPLRPAKKPANAGSKPQ